MHFLEGYFAKIIICICRAG